MINTDNPVGIAPDFSGLVHAGQTNTAEEYALLDRMGVSWLLATFYWSRIEPADDQWDFDWYDRYVDTAKAAGKKIIGVLGYDVPWIHENEKFSRYIPPDKMHYFTDFVRQTAEHFRGRVDAWCIWNEPNFNNWNGSKKDFFTLTGLAAEAIREADPDVILLGGAFNRNITGLPKAYIRGLYESGAMEKTDAVAFHPYELSPKRTLKLYNAFRKISDVYGFGSRIWITEVGYPTGGWYPTATTEKKFPAFVVKTIVKLASEGAQKVMWYQLADPNVREKRNSEDYFGLVRSDNDYTSKGAEAFRLCALYLSGTVYRPGLPQRRNMPKTLKAFYFENPGSGGTLVLWKEGKPVQLNPLQLELNDPDIVYNLHDPVSGNTVWLGCETDFTVCSMPVFITWGK